MTVDLTPYTLLVVGPCFLYIFYGMYDAAFQSLCYWAMGALSNDPATMQVKFTLTSYLFSPSNIQVLDMSLCINAFKRPVGQWLSAL